MVMSYILGESFNTSVYHQRRQRLAAYMKHHGGGIAILPTTLEIHRNRDNVYPYRADSYFYYLTGFTEPDSWLVMDDTGYSALFCRSKDPAQEVWTGYRLGPEDAPDVLGVNDAYAVEELDDIILDMFANQPAVWYPFATHSGLESQIEEWLSPLRGKVRSGVLCPQLMRDVCLPLDEMRLIKDEHEINLMRQAARISALGHIRAMQKSAQMIQAGEEMREYHLEAELLHEFCRHGAQEPSFNSIVASGKNACVLHYRAGHAPIRSGELVLIDAGCEYQYYAGDISRTFPANGQFTAAQRELYDLVLAAQESAYDEVRPGNVFKAAHLAALRILSQGMLDLGLLSKNVYGSVDDVMENKDYFRFYMHNTSHWLGLDVHDCGHYVDIHASRQQGEKAEFPSRTLQAGMVMTLEPGIYIQAAQDVPERFHDIGIRIEDDALVTGDGAELLTRDVPVLAREIEALMKNI